MSTVLVTGANRGIGLELARAYAARGDRVFATCRRPESASALRKMAQGGGAEITVVALDVADEASVAAAAVALGGQPLDILVNNAGVNTPDRQSTRDMDFDGWAHAFAVNTMGPLRVTQAVLANLRAARNARVAVISSRMGSFAGGGGGGQIAYRTTKAAVNRVVQLIAPDLARDGIAVAAFHPGWVATDMGGRGAPLSPRDSATDLVHLIDGLAPGQRDLYLDVDGRPIPW